MDYNKRPPLHLGILNSQEYPKSMNITSLDGTMSGGFSSAIHGNYAIYAVQTVNKDGCVISNNCRGANCYTACGVGGGGGEIAR
jgi:hypothetical protein